MATVKSTSKRTAPKRGTSKAAVVKTQSVKAEPVQPPAEAAAEAVEAAQEQVEALGSEVQASVEAGLSQTADLNRTALDAWAETGSALARGVEDMSKTWLRLTEQSVENGVTAARAMLEAKTLHEVVGVQSDYARNSFGSLFAEVAQLSELSVRVTREAMRPIQARIAAAAEKRPDLAA